MKNFRAEYDSSTILGENANHKTKAQNKYQTEMLNSGIEWWYFELFDESSNLEIIVTIFARYLITLRPHLHVNVIQNNRTVFAIDKSIPVENFTVIDDHHTFHLQFGNSSYIDEGNGIYLVTITTEEFYIQFTMTNIISCWIPISDPVIILSCEGKESSFANWIVHCPQGSVYGRLKLPNTSTIIEIKGHGYHDQNWGTLFIGGIEGWSWNRIQGYSTSGHKITALVTKFILSKNVNNQEINLLMLAVDNKIIVSSGESRINSSNYTSGKNSSSRYPINQEIFLPHIPNRISGKVFLQVSHIRSEINSIVNDLLPISEAIQNFYSNMLLTYYRLKSIVRFKFVIEDTHYIGNGVAFHEFLSIINEKWQNLMKPLDPVSILSMYDYRKSSGLWENKPKKSQ